MYTVWTHLEGGFSDDAAQQPVGPYFEQLIDGNKHRFTHEYKMATANTGTGTQSVSNGTLTTVLCIGGAIVLIGIAVVVTLVVVLRRRR